MAQEISSGIFLGKSGIFNIQSQSGFNTASETSEKPTEIKVNNSDYSVSGKVVMWGDLNNKPVDVVRQIKKTGVLGSAMNVRQSAHFGSGLSIYTEDETGEKNFIPYRKIPAFKQFDKTNNINRVFLDVIHDLEIHNIAFVEYILSRDFNSINRIKRHSACFARFEEMNPKTSKIENVYLNADWENYSTNSEYTSPPIPIFNFMDTAEEIKNICQQKNIHKFIVPITYTLDDEMYYPKPYWQAIIRNGWAKVVQDIPALKKSISENQLHFKFLISISEEYFKSTYKDDWDTFEPKYRLEKYEELVDIIDSKLCGPSAGGRSLTVPMYSDDAGNQLDSVKIEPIDDKLKEGAYLPDATAGNSEILFATQVDPSLIGQGVPGGKSISGSGSDKREAYTILCASLVASRMTSLLPFYLLRDWNQWGDDLDATFRNISLTTLDKNPTGSEQSNF